MPDSLLKQNADFEVEFLMYSIIESSSAKSCSFLIMDCLEFFVAKLSALNLEDSNQ